jgi:hypothetical protein
MMQNELLKNSMEGNAHSLVTRIFVKGYIPSILELFVVDEFVLNMLDQQSTKRVLHLVVAIYDNVRPVIGT